MKIIKYSAAAIVLLLVFVGSVEAGEGFPLRSKYPDVPYIELEDLAESYDSCLIVDVRSAFEFEVCHINKALHIQVSNRSFEKKIIQLSKKNPGKKIVFYCNGHTCKKSYKATKRALAAGLTNVVAFDAGIFDWIKAHPNRSTLMGQSPASPELLIAKSSLLKRTFALDEFRAAAEAGGVVIDIRDGNQRTVGKKAFKGMRSVPLDRLLKLVKAGKMKDKKLLFFDAVGKQVRWLQYHLEANGYSDYAFLKKGASVLK